MAPRRKTVDEWLWSGSAWVTLGAGDIQWPQPQDAMVIGNERPMAATPVGVIGAPAFQHGRGVERLCRSGVATMNQLLVLAARDTADSNGFNRQEEPPMVLGVMVLPEADERIVSGDRAGYGSDGAWCGLEIGQGRTRNPGTVNVRERRGRRVRRRPVARGRCG